MATSSFDQHFVVRTPEAAAQLAVLLEKPTRVTLSSRDAAADTQQGLALLQRLLLTAQNNHQTPR